VEIKDATVVAALASSVAVIAVAPEAVTRASPPPLATARVVAVLVPFSVIEPS
jgi:hypothetical protein